MLFSLGRSVQPCKGSATRILKAAQWVCITPFTQQVAIRKNIEIYCQKGEPYGERIECDSKEALMRATWNQQQNNIENQISYVPKCLW